MICSTIHNGNEIAPKKAKIYSWGEKFLLLLCIKHRYMYSKYTDMQCICGIKFDGEKFNEKCLVRHFRGTIMKKNVKKHCSKEQLLSLSFYLTFFVRQYKAGPVTHSAITILDSFFAVPSLSIASIFKVRWFKKVAALCCHV